ncbi:carbohydrate ABC transporter permease [Paenibacillus alginolyticus]|uniref:Carbohydrate ABC transporter permease n=1 Tax=Paenibacillus alginolyticus TaxID=59839 RepID=A0ABT4GPM3_9BACL|nr:carbohydrate ABC transporter permease [Paenibacillus alginolyticus]MCY9698177.1 carbohydrate ABC transporter permease [Paenibacillus alginolyticus]MEC0146723.1 carbohydrate ABC transporter permease [Paenibacillus alginolyticus]
MNNKKWSMLLKYTLLSVITFCILVPFYWMVSNSLKDFQQVLSFPPQWIPSPFKWENYWELFAKKPFHMYLFNSTYIAVLVTFGTCIFAAMAGYAFAKISFPLKNTIFLILLSSMMIPTEVTTIPLFTWLSKFGLVNTHFPLIVPPMLGAGGMFGVFLCRQFFITLPNDLDEAAKIDGCTPWQTFWRIMLPLAVPAMSTLSILTFLHSWNEFFEPLVYLNSSELYTIPLALSLFVTDAGTEWQIVMAAAVVATVPLLTVFFFAQKKFIEGIAMTGVK